MVKGSYIHQSLVCLFFLILTAGCEPVETISPTSVVLQVEATGYQTRNVVIVSIDGPRFTETWGQPEKSYIPNLVHNLGPLGVHYNWFYNLGPTYTSSGHTAITTGRYQIMQNDGTEIPSNPSIFQLYLNQTRKDPRSAQIITSKAKLRLLADCTDEEWRGKFNPKVDAIDREDSITLKVAMKVLMQDKPNLMLIHFKGPDANGHANNWTGYLNSIVETDLYLWELYNLLNTLEPYRNSTTLIVTNDHGRHLDNISDGFVGHGDFCEGCMHINLFATGPDFKAGEINNKSRELIDVAPTVAELLGFKIPNPQGYVLKELFNNQPI